MASEATAQVNTQVVPNGQTNGGQSVGSTDGIVQGALAPPSYPKFLSYPTSHTKPPFIDSGDPANDQIVHEMRLQHWYFLFDQKQYIQRYGALPTNLPGGVKPREYADNPPIRAFSQDLEDYISGNQTQTNSQSSTN